MIPLTSALHSVLQAAEASATPVYVVGGVVRDLLLRADCEQFDVDVLVDGPSDVVARAVARDLGGSVTRHERFLTAKVLFDPKPSTTPSAALPNASGEITEIDFASARTETYREPGALPDVIAAPLSEDLRRRDFTINAMALPLRDYYRFFLREITIEEAMRAVLDPFDGKVDLLNRTIRTLHQQSFIDDPTRIVRAVRYKVRLDGMFDPRTEALLHDAISVKVTERLSMQRYARELLTALDESNPSRVISELSALGMVKVPFDVSILDRISFIIGALDLEVHSRGLRAQRNVLRRELLLAYLSTALPEKEFKSLPVGAAERKRAAAVASDRQKSFGDKEREDLVRSFL